MCKCTRHILQIKLNLRENKIIPKRALRPLQTLMKATPSLNKLDKDVRDFSRKT